MKLRPILMFLAWGAVLQAKAQAPAIGIVWGMESDAIITDAGYNCILESVDKCLSPKKVSDTQFAERLLVIRKLKTPIYGYNLFIPGDLKLVGPDVNEKAILDHVSVVLERCERSGVKLITWGSGGARRIPDGFDRSTARAQFIRIAKKVAAIAKKHHVVLALENLNSGETNFINTVREALEIVSAVDHRNFRLCADVYHMLKENEPPEVIFDVKKVIVHCELAEKDQRTPPGTKGDDFRPYLRVLKQIDYNGKIILECRWDDLPKQARPARLALQTQIDEVFHGK